MVTILHRNVPVVCGASYHLLGHRILQDSKIRFRLQVESYISDWLFSELQLLASYVSRHKAMACDRVASTTRINLEEPVRVASTTRINLEEPISSGYPAQPGLTWRNPSGWPAQPGLNLEEPVRVASPTRINLEEPVRVASPTRIKSFSVCLWVCLIVRAKRGID